MANFNRVVLVGNLTRDPDYREINDTKCVCRLGLAVNRTFKDKDRSEVCFIDVDVWGSQGTACKRYLEMGSSVLVEGRLKYESWEDKDGSRRSRHIVVADRVVFMSKSDNDAKDTDVVAEAAGVLPF